MLNTALSLITVSDPHPSSSCKYWLIFLWEYAKQTIWYNGKLLPSAFLITLIVSEPLVTLNTFAKSFACPKKPFLPISIIWPELALYKILPNIGVNNVILFTFFSLGNTCSATWLKSSATKNEAKSISKSSIKVSDIIPAELISPVSGLYFKFKVLLPSVILILVPIILISYFPNLFWKLVLLSIQ